jgi:myo-inositol 2-dehydrogenase/D-chiro-inositol 1-dehydrogenase
MRSQKGVLIHINNSRRAVYGYDQRVEIFGSKGMMISNNQSPTSVEKFDKNMTYAKDPIHFFFMERYEQAYKDHLDDFVNIVMNNEKPSVTFEDGRNALLLANAAYESFETGKSTKVNY